MHLRCFISSIFSSNIYALEELETNNVWLIDAGYSEELMEYLSSNKNLKGIFLTHIHFDHISGLNELTTKFPEVKVFGHSLCYKYLHNPEKNLSLFYEFPISYKGKIYTIKENEEIFLTEYKIIKTYGTPGHHPTCITYKLGHYLFTGDSYIPQIKVVTHLPEGDKVQAKQSNIVIEKLIDNMTIICPGHTIN